MKCRPTQIREESPHQLRSGNLRLILFQIPSSSGVYLGPHRGGGGGQNFSFTEIKVKCFIHKLRYTFFSLLT